jgi:hypothetical protein
MTKLLFKTTFFTLLLCLVAFLSKAQLGYNYAQYDVGFGGNTNMVYGDAETSKNTPSAHINFTYNHTPYINYVAEAQAGVLEGGSEATKSGRYFKNVYKAVIFRGQLQAGEFIDYSKSKIFNALKNVYASAGFGLIINDIQSINRTSFVVPNYTTPGENNTQELFLPVKLGYEFKVFNRHNEPYFKIDIGSQYNYVFGDNLDGFNAGRSNDKFVQYSITLKFAVGGVISYSKKISY